MALIHHVVAGQGLPPVVFVHGFGCAHGDWDRQVAYFSPTHQTVAVDLRGHGASPGSVDLCSIERYGADVTEAMHALALRPAVLVGHSMGCRVVTEAALQAPDRTAGVVLLDGSQFAGAMGPVLRKRFAEPDGYATMVTGMFTDMFTAKSDPHMAASVVARAQSLPRPVGEKMLLDMQRYDTGRLAQSLASLKVPVMAIQSTYSNDKRERRPLLAGQTTAYLDMLRARIPLVQVEIVPDTGHFPQIDESERTNELIGRFIASITAG